MQFITPKDRENESKLFNERFIQIAPTLQSILGHEASDFTKIFCDEIINPNSYMEYDKKIIRAIKTQIFN